MMRSDHQKLKSAIDDNLPIINLSSSPLERSEVARLIVKACEEYGFFKVINHGVPNHIIAKMEEVSFKFFNKPVTEKQQATPFGYGCKNIGFNGDSGEVEYLLFPTKTLSIAQAQTSNPISIDDDPTKFRSVVSSYIEAVRELACKILDLMAEGLWVHDKSAFSKLIRDVESDSVFRLNHYPPVLCSSSKNNNSINGSSSNSCKVGFGVHSDPQILTILRSNDVGGLEISPDHGVWIPVSPDPTTFFINVAAWWCKVYADEAAALAFGFGFDDDNVNVMTNGKFVSVKHRVLSNSAKSRMSVAYFGAPSLNARVTTLPELVTPTKPCLYRPFTWAEYKKTVYSLRLGDSRLEIFRK
ncbi:hypothetical protein EZV62_000025 [Acer yangbiense]|uniref:gibberellin 2beta-dioxygenase n=1 Tax=Acer yangbiense TaxID=1000413 RepID=A0A5C7ISI0_9ROSI|nr:hypothetical protein EZV62_000025 [Acer yangbiense]